MDYRQYYPVNVTGTCITKWCNVQGVAGYKPMPTEFGPKTGEEQTDIEKWSGDHGEVEVLRDGNGRFVTWSPDAEGENDQSSTVPVIDQIEVGETIEFTMERANLGDKQVRADVTGVSEEVKGSSLAGNKRTVRVFELDFKGNFEFPEGVNTVDEETFEDNDLTIVE